MVTTLLRFKKSQVLIEVGNDTTKVKENIQNTNYKALFAMLSISIIDIERITKAYNPMLGSITRHPMSTVCRMNKSLV